MKKKILLVDDEKNFCTLLKMNLEKRGPFEVLTTSNPQEVLKLAKANKPDLILLDILMPEMDGMTLAAALKGDEDTKQIMIAFLTALVNEEDVRDMKGKTGANYFFSKLGTTEELMKAISGILL
ncbi:MAG: response regulator [Thermodesulfovibrio sp.]|nr:response regulator [Thermodesulfovibrio sp.]